MEIFAYLNLSVLGSICSGAKELPKQVDAIPGAVVTIKASTGSLFDDKEDRQVGVAAARARFLARKHSKTMK